MKDPGWGIIYDACPICAAAFNTWRTKQNGKTRYNIDLCVSCGQAFVNPRPPLEFLIDYYSSVVLDHDSRNVITSLRSVLAEEETDPNSTIDAKRMISTINTLANTVGGAKFLDVGCGYGFFSKEALDAGYDVVALELAGKEREVAREMTGLTPIACSFEEFEYAAGSLNVVFMSQILEHALDINAWIKKSHALLVEGGLIAVAVPNYGSIFRIILQENEPYICPPAHLNFFNSNSLSILLENHGFAVEEVQWVSRIPLKTFENRLPKVWKPLLPIVDAISTLSLKTIDMFHLGMMINVYARKISD